MALAIGVWPTWPLICRDRSHAVFELVDGDGSGDLGVCLLVTGSARCASRSGRWRLRNPMDGSCLDLGAVVFAISWVWRKMLDFEWSKWDADGSGPSANGVWPWTLNDVGGCRFLDACCRRQLMTDGAGGCCLVWIGEEGRLTGQRRMAWIG
ncbi:hypothetical protein ACLOJK_024260 [Asimina triloba]